MINTHRGNLSLSFKQCLELISLLEIPDSQRLISLKKLERLIGIGHFYAVQVALNHTQATKRAVVDLYA